jgi:uncharacterized protein
MNKYLPRWIAAQLDQMRDEASIIVLTGPRQVGKSTLLYHELGEKYTFFNLDDMDILDQMRRDATGILSISDQIVIDEAQRAPESLLTVKRLVDQNPEKRFILSGSANLMLMAQISDSLAGRAQFLHMAPMTLAELHKNPPPAWFLNLLQSGQLQPPDDKIQPIPANQVWHGGMPIRIKRTTSDSLTRWREGYLESYLERDLRQLSMIDSLPDFRRLMRLAALRNAQLINQSQVARDAGLSQPTAHRYLNLLETSEWIYTLPAFLNNRSLRVMKTPKIHWFDSGMAAHIQGHFTPIAIQSVREWGGLWETWVLNQIRPLCQLLTPRADLYYWRLRSGEEVDAVIQRGNLFIPLEIKSKSSAGYNDIKSLQIFMENHPTCQTGLLFYTGNDIKQLTDKIWAMPVSTLY